MSKTFTEEEVLKIIHAAKYMFPSLVASNGVLLVPVCRYNEFADVCNSIINKEEGETHEQD